MAGEFPGSLRVAVASGDWLGLSHPCPLPAFTLCPVIPQTPCPAHKLSPCQQSTSLEKNNLLLLFDFVEMVFTVEL